MFVFFAVKLSLIDGILLLNSLCSMFFFAVKLSLIEVCFVAVKLSLIDGLFYQRYIL